MIAVLGASGYIGRSLARLLATGVRPVHLFAREPEKLANESWPAHVTCRALADFHADDFDLVINAIGAGDPARVTAAGPGILDITNEWDQRVLTSLRPGKTRYVYLSSGVVSGIFDSAANADSVLTLPASRLENVSPYLLSKLHAEARHRRSPDQAILDIRVFSYADAGIDIHGSFFLAQLCKSILSGEPFVTSRSDMVRDYAGAAELHELIDCWGRSGAPNRAVDLYTREPVSKSVLLQHAMARYGIEVGYTQEFEESSTAAKSVYSSAHPSAAGLGYIPRRNSLQVVAEMLDKVALKE